MLFNKLLIDNEDTLFVFIPLMIVLALAGVILAGVSEEIFYRTAGYALFAVSVAWTFANLKGYYDAQDHRRHKH